MKVSNCCRSKLVYLVGRNIKIDIRNENAEKFLPKGIIVHYECGKCHEMCDLVNETEPYTNELCSSGKIADWSL